MSSDPRSKFDSTLRDPAVLFALCAWSRSLSPSLSALESCFDAHVRCQSQTATLVDVVRRAGLGVGSARAMALTTFLDFHISPEMRHRYGLGTHTASDPNGLIAGFAGRFYSLEHAEQARLVLVDYFNRCTRNGNEWELPTAAQPSPQLIEALKDARGDYVALIHQRIRSELDPNALLSAAEISRFCRPGAGAQCDREHLSVVGCAHPDVFLRLCSLSDLSRGEQDALIKQLWPDTECKATEKNLDRALSKVLLWMREVKEGKHEENQNAQYEDEDAEEDGRASNGHDGESTPTVAAAAAASSAATAASVALPAVPCTDFSPESQLLSYAQSQWREVKRKQPRKPAPSFQTVLRKARKGQAQFRAAVLSTRPACVITGLAVPNALEAAHILQYAHSSLPEHQVFLSSSACPQGVMSPHNGVMLRRDLHTLFDEHLIRFEVRTDSSGQRSVWTVCHPAVAQQYRSNRASPLELDGLKLVAFPAESTAFLERRNLPQSEAAWKKAAAAAIAKDEDEGDSSSGSSDSEESEPDEPLLDPTTVARLAASKTEAKPNLASASASASATRAQPKPQTVLPVVTGASKSTATRTQPKPVTAAPTAAAAAASIPSLSAAAASSASASSAPIIKTIKKKAVIAATHPSQPPQPTPIPISRKRTNAEAQAQASIAQRKGADATSSKKSKHADTLKGTESRSSR